MSLNDDGADDDNNVENGSSNEGGAQALASWTDGSQRRDDKNKHCTRTDLTHARMDKTQT